MHKRRQVLLAAVFIALALAGLFVSYRYGNQFLVAYTKGGPMPCSGRHATLRVNILHGAASPDSTRGQLCDTLIITNKDPIDREIAFGPHEDHVPYDGVAEQLLEQGQSLTITLNQAGTFHFHDHIHDEVQGYFTVQK